MTSIRKKLGEAVRRLRKERGFDAAMRFAVAAKIDRTHLTDIEAGRLDVDIDVLARIASALDMTLAELFTAAEQESATEIKSSAPEQCGKRDARPAS